MTATRARWHWTLLALLPGLLSDVMWLASVFGRRSPVLGISLLSDAMFYSVWLMPFVGAYYLVQLAHGYIASGLSNSNRVLGFVLKFAAIDLGLWLAGFGLLVSRLNYPM